MRKIYKEVLEPRLDRVGDHLVCELQLPSTAAILRVDHQPGVGACLWYSFLPAHGKSVVRVAIVPTGGTIPERGVSPRYLNTFFQDNGTFVWHAYLL